jgi:hypothetical protein
MLFADPLFDEEAMKQRIFTFKPGSPAPGLGIEPIDLRSGRKYAGKIAGGSTKQHGHDE